MEQLIIYLGFIITAYAVIANDVIQTLGTFIASNQKIKLWLLWGFTSLILTLTLFYGWQVNRGDASYGQLGNFPLPEVMKWWYLLAPIVLLLITRYGIPVSTTFLILSVFSTPHVIEKMILKSVLGYALGFVFAIIVYWIVSRLLESKASIRLMGIKKQKNYWLVAQWFSTGFLWSQWFIQDSANIYVFLPRSLSLNELLLSLGVILSIMAYIFKNKGGKIQDFVTNKFNTENVRSATIIDLIYGVLLYVLNALSNIPISTTLTFIGILAGREIAIKYLLDRKQLNQIYTVVFKDLAKVNIGLIISVLIAYGIQLLKT